MNSDQQNGHEQSFQVFINEQTFNNGHRTFQKLPLDSAKIKYNATSRRATEMSDRDRENRVKILSII